MNFYEQPVAQKFMDTYAPLPFQEMAMLGAAYKKEKDATEASIDEFKATYGDFTSMSQSDTKAWDDETMGRITPKLMQMAADPEQIKSQEFQAGIRNAIRGVRSSKISDLRQSSENLKQRATIIAKLQAEGRYKKSWDDINIAEWDTSRQGIMTDLAPLEYKTLHDIAAPYSQALKPQYLGKIDRYRYWEGVDESQIRQSLNSASTDILSTPQGAAWYRDISSELAMQGINDPKAVREEVMNRLVQSQKDYMHKNLAYDKAALQEDELAIRRKASAGNEAPPSNTPARYTDMIRLDGKRYLNTLTEKTASSRRPEDTAAITKASMDLQIANVKGNREEIASAQYALEQIQNNTRNMSLSDTIRSNFEYAIGRPIGKHGTPMNRADMIKGSKSVIDMLSSDNDLSGAQTILRNASNAVPKKDSTYEFTLGDSRQLQNPSTVVTSLSGMGLRKRANDFDKLLSNGALKNLTITPVTTKGLFNYTDKDGKFKQKQRVVVSLKESDLDIEELPGGKAYWSKERIDKLLKSNGAQITEAEPSSVSVTESGELDDGDFTGLRRSTTVNTKAQDNYITFEAFIDVPEDASGHQGTVVSSMNAEYNRVNLSDKDASSIYSQEQDDAFYGNLDNILEN